MKYAVYKDDEFLLIGTLKEIAKYLGESYGTIKSYKARSNTGSRKSPYIFIEVEIDENI